MRGRSQLIAVCVALLLMSGLSLVAIGQSPCMENAGTVTRETYYSVVLGQTMYYTVYTPPCYDDAQEYPVIVLMHGSNDNDGQWVRMGLADQLDQRIGQGTAPPVIAIMPFGNLIANRNQFERNSWNNIFLTEMLPDAEEKYALDSRPEYRAIGGISRGGFWAYQIGLNHPELFGHIGGHSAYFDLYHAPDEFNPLDLALTSEAIFDQRLWLDRGRDDYAAPGLEIMHERLTERDVPHVYQADWDGQHYITYWTAHVSDYLDWYLEPWQNVEPDVTPTVTAADVTGFATNTPAAEPQPVPTRIPFANPQEETMQGLSLFVPVVAFPSLMTTVSLDQMANIAFGEHDAALVLTETTFAELRDIDVALHPDTQIIPDDSLRQHLWNNREQFALVPFDALTPDYRMLWVDDRSIIEQLDSYPFAFQRGTAHFQPENLTRITLSGVTALARRTLTALDENGIEWAASGIQDYVKSSDYFHTSNEVSILQTCPQSNGVVLGAPAFCTKPEHAELLNLIDLDIVELSGNHNNDFGYEPYLETLTFYADSDIMTVGGGETTADARTPLIIEHNGATVAMLACNIPGPYYAIATENGLTDDTPAGRPGSTYCDNEWLGDMLPQLQVQHDLVILTIQHWEFEQYVPTPEQRFDFRRFADLGADIVMGTHAHKPQTYEFYSNIRGTQSVLHYGMGNLFFDQPWWGNSRFFMNTLYIYDGHLLFVEVFPGIIEGAARPRLMTPDERENFLFFMFRQQNGF